MTDVPINMVRLRDLNVGDCFIWAGISFKIYSRDENGIKLKHSTCGGHYWDFGIKCQMWVEYVPGEKLKTV